MDAYLISLWQGLCDDVTRIWKLVGWRASRSTHAVRGRNVRGNTCTALARSALLLLLCVAPPPTAAGIFRWTDSDGTVHFSDRPPPQALADPVTVRVTRPSVPLAVVGDEERPAATAVPVVIYTTERCGYCKRAKAYFHENGIAFTEYDVERTQKGREDYRKMGGHGVPIILVGGERLNGFNPDHFQQLLNRVSSR